MKYLLHFLQRFFRGYSDLDEDRAHSKMVWARDHRVNLCWNRYEFRAMQATVNHAADYMEFDEPSYEVRYLGEDVNDEKQ